MGRPTKYQPGFAARAKWACESFGFTDEDLARLLEVSTRTIANWQIEHPEFLQAVREGREKFTTDRVDTALVNAACGYYHQVEKFFPELDNGDGTKGAIVKLWQWARPDARCMALYYGNMGRLRPSPRPDGGGVRGNLLPPGAEGIGDLDEAARRRLEAMSIEILEGRYGTTIKHVEAVDVTDDEHGSDIDDIEPADESTDRGTAGAAGGRE